MKTLIVLLALLVGGLTVGTAQDFYLPVSSTSKAAVASLHRAAERYANVHFKEGKAELDKALAEDPNLFMAHVYAVQYAPKAARPALLDKALALDAKNLTQAEKIMRGLMVKWQKDPDYQPADDMKALVAAYPNTPQALEWASLHSFHTNKDVDAGMDYAQQLARLRPNYAPNYNTMGYMYMEQKEMDKAKAALEKYVALAPNEPNAYDSLAEFYLVAKDYAKSAEYYDKAAGMGLTEAKDRADKARRTMKLAPVKAQIQSLENQYADAVNARNAPAIAAFYAEDAVSMTDDAPMLVGRAAIQKDYETTFAKSPQGITTAFEILDVFGDENTVTEVGKALRKDASGAVVATGKYMAVWEKRGGKYVCVRDISNDDQKAK